MLKRASTLILAVKISAFAELKPIEIKPTEKLVHSAQVPLLLPVLPHFPTAEKDTPSLRLKKQNFSSKSLVKCLWEALCAAYCYNVDLLNQRQEVKKVVEKMAQFRSEWRPSLSIQGKQGMRTGSFGERDKRLDDDRESSNKGKQTAHSSQLSFNAQQNLYKGGATVAQQAKAREEFKAALCKLKSIEQSVFAKVIEAFFKALRAEMEWEIQKIYEGHLTDLHEQTKVRYELDDKGMSELAMSKVKLNKAIIQTVDALAEVKSARAVLQSLIEMPLAAKLVMPAYYKKLPDSIQKLLAIALKNNPILASSYHIVRGSRYDIASASSGFLPQVTLSASAGPAFQWEKTHVENHVEDQVQSVNRSRATRQNNVNVELSLNIPLSTTGEVQSKYRLANLQLKQAILELQSNQRRVEQDCVVRFNSFKAAQQNAQLAKSALEANQVALDSGRTLYALGMNSLYDIIEIEETWLSTHRQYVSLACNLVQSSYLTLESMGSLTATSLHLPIKLYDPFQYYHDYHNAIFSLGEGAGDIPRPTLKH